MNNQRFSQAQLIGSGGFAKVYRAFDAKTQRVVAVKELTNPTPDLVRRFKRERDILQIHLDNPFVVKILDSDFSGPNPYLVLEYSSLGSLQEYILNRRNWRRIAGWLCDIAYGLTMIHERGGLIRDVKPSNLLRFKRADGSDLIKIADFGLAQKPEAWFGGMTTSVFGTTGYIDPVAQLSGNFRAASDIYSLGVTMKELLTGTKGVLNGIPGPAEFQALILSMTESDVDKRPTAREVLQEVQRILRGSSVPAVQPPNTKGLGWLLAGTAVLVGACLLASSD